MRTLKRLSTLLIAVLITVCIFGAVQVCAAGDYSIPSLTVDAVINQDGSVTIMENWIVNYESGSFTRFYHDISTWDLPDDERFGKIRDVNVWIDGTACEFTEDTQNRPDYHYNLDSNYAGGTLAAYLRSESGTRSYVMCYTLEDVVKRVDGDYYLFVYRFVGKNFSARIKKLTINLSVPEGCVPDVRYQSNGSTEISGNTVTINGSSDSESMYKLRVRMDGGSIPGAVPIRSSQLSNKKDTLSKVAHFAGIAIPSGIGIGILFLIISSIIRGSRINKRLKESGMSYPRELINSLRGAFSPLELACSLSSDRLALLLQLMYMAAGRRLETEQDDDGRQYVCIPFNCNGYDAQETALIAAMTDYCQKEGIPAAAGGYRVSLEDFGDAMRADPDYKYSLNAQVYSPIETAIREKKQDKEVKKLHNTLSQVLTHAQQKNLLPVIDEGRLLSSYGDHETMLYYALSAFHGDRAFSPAEDRTGYYYWSYYSDSLRSSDYEYDTLHSSDSSGGSGCSSCSSCSSCGGGGAD